MNGNTTIPSLSNSKAGELKKTRINPMSDTDQNSIRKSDPKDHLANERTYLAWIRTSIGIMAFGFVVEKFAIFVKQIALLLGKENLGNVSLPASHLQGYSSIFGVTLVSLECLLPCLLLSNTGGLKNKSWITPIVPRSFRTSCWP